MTGRLDAVVVGSGPNGLAAAVVLAAAGLRVRVVEGASTPGGGCRTAETTLPGHRHDICSAVHPLAAASPFFRRFDLAARGVRLLPAEVAYAHPLDDGRAAAAHGSVADTAADLGADALAYRRLFGPPVRNADTVVDAMLAPLRWPPARPWPVARFGLAGVRSARRLAARFRRAETRALLAGVAAHGMQPLDRPVTGGLALLLGTLAHSVGWPLVAGGSQQIVTALLAELHDRGGELETGRWVRSLEELPPARAVLLDVTPRALAAIAGDRLPAGYRRALRRFRYGPGICKVDWVLTGPVPWRAEVCRRAPTVHVGGSFEEIARSEAEVAAGRHPADPYVLTVQPGVVDPSRAPAGHHTLWTYCHVPAGSSVDMTQPMARQLERFAPGFRDLVVASAARTARQTGEDDPNYVGGDIGAGVQDLRQTLARPVARWNPYRTPLDGVYLCSSSTPPGPGVHGRCGEIAATHALREVFGVRRAPDLGPRQRAAVCAPAS